MLEAKAARSANKAILAQHYIAADRSEDLRAASGKVVTPDASQ